MMFSEGRGNMGDVRNNSCVLGICFSPCPLKMVSVTVSVTARQSNKKSPAPAPTLLQ